MIILNSVLQEICTLRKKSLPRFDLSNKNRYRLVANEEDGTKTAYYFSVPIYNQTSKKLLDFGFEPFGNYFRLLGSNCNIIMGDRVVFEGQENICEITMPNGYRHKIDRCIVYQNVKVFPTTNGIAIKAELNSEKSHRFLLRTQTPFCQIRNNGKYFALMQEKFKPLITVSCIGSLYHNGDIFAPSHIKHKKLDDRETEITVSSDSPYAKYVLFEINMYEPKLFQDTTVESKNPKQNNAFGGTAFIGNSMAFGEQWLYSRPDFSLLGDLLDQHIDRATLHIPSLQKNGMRLSAVGLSSRFCSFGSNWSNKKSGNQKEHPCVLDSGYHNIDITGMITYGRRLLTQSEGWIIKSAAKDSGFSAISSGDNFYAPQILEISFK